MAKKVFGPLSPTPEEILAKMKKLKEVHWYGVRVASQHERKLVDMLKEKLDKDPTFGVKETYVPIRQEKHRWSDRIKVVDQVLTPSLIFIRTSMEHKNDVFLTRDVKSYVYAPGGNKPCPIADNVMMDFIRIIDANYDFKMTLPLVGEDVMVLEGPLKGVVGQLVKIDGDHQLIIRLNDAFGASVTMDPLSVSKVPKGTVSIPAEHVPSKI